MKHTRALAISLIVVIMVALPWVVPLAWNATPGWLAESVILGIPVQLTFYPVYGAVACLALWGVFRLIWPSADA